MEERRVKRYFDKIGLIIKRMNQIGEWLSIEVDKFKRDEKTKLATYKAFQEIAESCMDIISMMCRDTGIIPKDDYTNIENVSEKISINEDILKEVNGLRNVLIRRYNSMDDELAYESIKRLLPEIEKFVEVVENWLKKNI